MMSHRTIFGLKKHHFEEFCDNGRNDVSNKRLDRNLSLVKEKDWCNLFSKNFSLVQNGKT